MLQEFTSDDAKSGRTPRAGKYDSLWQLSMSDPHTGLANQLLLLDRLTQALARMRRHGGEVVVCHVNLDNLGEINTDLGYTIGNTVLCEMADRLTSVLRTEDTIGRVGGNELVVVLAVTDEQSVGPLTRRLQKTLDEPVVVGGQPIRLRVPNGTPIGRVGQRSFSGGQRGMDDLARGTLVDVKFNAAARNGEGVATHIDILATPGAAFTFSGNVSVLDVHDGELTIVDPHDNQSYQFFFYPTQLSISSKLHEGSLVQVTANYDGSRYVATQITME